MQNIKAATSRCFWQGALIRLRPFRSEDVDAICEAEQDSESIRVFEPGIYPMRSADMVRQALEHDLKHAPANVLSFAVEALTTGELVGTANIRDWQNRQGTFGFAIRIYQAHQRKGYAKEAARILLRYGFYELRCQKANSATIAFNEASIHLHRVLGFQEEGRLRRNCYTDGQYWDEILFGLTREEFDKLEQES